MAAWRRPLSRVACATRRGSSSSVTGGRPVSIAQNPQVRGQTLPRIMNVGVPGRAPPPPFPARLLLIGHRRSSGVDRAEPAVPRADAPEDHERGGAEAPALPHVRAAGLL